MYVKSRSLFRDSRDTQCVYLQIMLVFAVLHAQFYLTFPDNCTVLLE